MHLINLVSTTAVATWFSITAARICGTPSPSDQQYELTGVMLDHERDAKKDGLRIQSLDYIEVETYFHVVAADDTAEGGYLPESTLDSQLAVMNAAYAPHNIQFTLLGTDYTVNPTWTVNDDETAMKSALRKGYYSTLNLYFVQQMDDGNIGACTYPVAGYGGTNDTTSSDVIQDGCVILAGTLPGGDEDGWNLGYTVVHEVGHWFNLYHTFEGNCCGSGCLGDQIDDTPNEYAPNYSCPADDSRVDTCPSDPGTDPIHNYMDYSPDACYTEFTADQQVRMFSAWETFRG